MKTVGYVLFGIGCFLFVVAYFVYTSGPPHVVHHGEIDVPGGISIVGFCIWIVGILLVSIVTLREQAAERAYRKAHPEPASTLWDSWKDIEI
jgi:hypothetical protein